METNYKMTKVKTFIMIAFVSLCILFSTLFFGCRQQMVVSVVDYNFDIDKLIYTNDVNKYIDGRELVTGTIQSNPESSVSTSLDLASLKALGIYLVKINDTTVDLIFDTNTISTSDSGVISASISNNPMNSIYFMQELYYVAGLFSATKVDNVDQLNPILPTHSYLFSNSSPLFLISQYDLFHDNPNCSCGIANVDLDFGTNYRCECWSLANSCPDGEYYYDPNLPSCCFSVITTPVTATYTITEYKSIYKNAEGAEIVGEIWKVDSRSGEISRETVNDTTGLTFIRNDSQVIESGEYETGEMLYQVTHTCTCELITNYKEPILQSFNEEGGGLEEYQTTINFNQLIIDGLDLSYIDEFINKLLDTAKQFPEYDQFNYDQYINLNDYSHMFDNLPCKYISLNNITGITSEIKDLSYMFANCKNLISVDFGNFFDNVKPTDISFMFYNCPNLAYVDLSGLDTSNVTNMQNMFSKSISLSFEKRNEYIDYLINEKLIPFANSQDMNIPTTNNGNKWTLDDAAEWAIENNLFGDDFSAFSPEDQLTIAKYQIVLVALELQVMYNDTLFPVSYDEMVGSMTNFSCLTLDDFVNAVNNNPSEFGLTAKENGEPYTKIEIELYIQKELTKDEQTKNIEIVRNEDLDLAYQYQTDYISFNNREEEINFLLAHSGKVLTYLDSYDIPLSNNGDAWTIEDITEYMILNNSTIQQMYQNNPEGAYAMVKVEIIYNLLGIGYKIPLTFDDITVLETEGQLTSFDELVVLINQNPEDFGLSKKEDGTDYTAEELQQLLKQMAQSENITILTPEELNDYYNQPSSSRSYIINLYEFTTVKREHETRDALINQYLDEFVEYYNGLSSTKNKLPETLNGKPYTIDNIIPIMIQLDESLMTQFKENSEQVYKLTKINIISSLIELKHNIPITYDEFAILSMEDASATFSDLVDLINENPSSFNLPQKEDGSLYTEDEIKEFINTQISASGFTAQLQEEVETYTTDEIIKVFAGTKTITGTILVLGGDDSKFKISESINIDNMLSNSNFDTIVAPEIADGIEIELGENYIYNNSNTQTLTSEHSNQTIHQGYIETPTDPSDPTDPSNPVDPTTPDSNNKTLIIVLSIIGLIIVIAAITIAIIVAKKNKKQN